VSDRMGMRAINRAALLILLVIAPVYWVPGVSISLFSLVKDAIFVSTLGCFVLYILMEKKGLRILRDPVLLLLLTLLVIVFFRTLFTDDIIKSLSLFLRYFLAPVLIFVVTYNVLSAKTYAARMAKAITAPVIMMVAYAALISFHLIQPFSTPGSYFQNLPERMSLSFGRGSFAVSIALSLPFLVGMTVQLYKKRRAAWVGGVLVNVFLLIAIVNTLARSALVAALLGAGLVIYSFSRRLAVFLVVVMALLIGLVYAPQTSIWLRIATGAETFTSGRVYLYSAATNMISEHPIAGVGLGKFSSVAGKYLPRAIISRWSSSQPHNLFLWIAAENGVLAGFLAFLFVGLITWKTVIFALKSHSLLLASFAGSVIVGSALSLVDAGIIFSTLYLTIPWWVSAAVVLKYAKLNRTIVCEELG